MARNNRFAKGSGAYTCSNCGKKTRSTGRGDNEHVGLCADCYDCGGDENAVADGSMTQAEFDQTWPKGHPSRSDTRRAAKEAAASAPTPQPAAEKPSSAPTPEEFSHALKAALAIQVNYLNVLGAPLSVQSSERRYRFSDMYTVVHFEARELPKPSDGGDFFGAAFSSVSAEVWIGKASDSDLSRGFIPCRLHLRWEMREFGSNGTTRDLWYSLHDGQLRTRDEMRALGS